MSAVQVDLVPCLIPVFDGPADVRGARGGRGSGKTQTFAKMVAVRGYMFGSAGVPGQLVCARQFMNSLEDSSLEECKRAIESEPFLAAYYEVGEKYIKSRDGMVSFTFCGLERNVESVKSKGRILVFWIDEARGVSQKALDIVEPTLREEGEDWNAELWITWNPELDTDPIEQYARSTDPLIKVVDCNYKDNPRFPERLERRRLRDLATKSKHEYEWIWEGKFLPAVQGAIYFDEVAGAESKGRIREVPYDPLLKVHGVWDLGWNDSMSIILVQRSASEIRVIDYIEDSHRTLSDYAQDLKAKGLNWGNQYLPHDGYTKDFKTGKSAQEILAAMGLSVPGDTQNPGIPRMDIESGIKAAREVFPRIYFDKDKTGRLVECLKRYRRHINQQTREPGQPLHDAYSHGADAFRYLALVADQLSNDEWGGSLNYPRLSYA